ncbi:MAG: hypothetical protein Ct9H300mP21_05400 [Pseudomonadota bacterium]|nr:MAG: hypothetical protein Ct9H300mP21_05400 [Pseudomonadota bacterium]
MIDLQPVKGTRDFFPDKMRLRNWLFEVWRNVSVQAGFEEYDTCVLEHEDFISKRPETKFSKQLYSFEDKGGRRLSFPPRNDPFIGPSGFFSTKNHCPFQ